MRTLPPQRLPQRLELRRSPSPVIGNGIADVISYISRLGLQDIQSLQSRARTGNSSVSLTDEELALSLFAEEAEGLLNIARGHAFAGANNDDARFSTVSEELEEMEEAARYDHLVALAISQGRPIPPRPERHQRARRFLTPSSTLLSQPQNVPQPLHTMASSSAGLPAPLIPERPIIQMQLDASTSGGNIRSLGPMVELSRSPSTHSDANRSRYVRVTLI